MAQRSLTVSKTGRSAGTPAAVGQMSTMSTNTTDREELTGDAPVQYSTHIEPAHVGGQRYVRCEACGAELLCSLGGADRMTHAADCPASIE